MSSITADDIGARAASFHHRPRFGSLDALRALAVLAVVWHHTVNVVPGVAVASRGFLGVDLFFVLSGFLITIRLLRERRDHGSVSLRGFYVRRTLRIFPLYYAVVLGCLALGLVMPGEQWDAIADSAPALLLYATNWFPTISLLAVSWSLATEEQFYLVWPPLQKLLGGAALPAIGVFLAANQLVNFGLLFPAARLEHEILQVTFTPLCLGVILAYLLHQRFDRLWPMLGSRAALPVVAVALLVAVAWPGEVGAAMVGPHRLVIHLLLTALVGAVVVREDHVLASAARQPVLVRLGVVSYGIYLLHMFVRHAVVEVWGKVGAVPLPTGVLFVVVATLTFAAAEVSFRWFEAPILALKSARLPWHRPMAVEVSRS